MSDFYLIDWNVSEVDKVQIRIISSVAAIFWIRVFGVFSFDGKCWPCGLAHQLLQMNNAVCEVCNNKQPDWLLFSTQYQNLPNNV